MAEYWGNADFSYGLFLIQENADVEIEKNSFLDQLVDLEEVTSTWSNKQRARDAGYYMSTAEMLHEYERILSCIDILDIYLKLYRSLFLLFERLRSRSRQRERFRGTKEKKTSRQREKSRQKVMTMINHITIINKMIKRSVAKNSIGYTMSLQTLPRKIGVGAIQAKQSSTTSGYASNASLQNSLRNSLMNNAVASSANNKNTAQQFTKENAAKNSNSSRKGIDFSYTKTLQGVTSVAIGSIAIKSMLSTVKAMVKEAVNKVNNMLANRAIDSSSPVSGVGINTQEIGDRSQQYNVIRSVVLVRMLEINTGPSTTTSCQIATRESIDKGGMNH